MTPKTIFSPSQLKTIVDTIRPSVPSGHTNAIVGLVDTTGVQVIAVAKFDQGRWEVSGAVRHDWSGDTQAAAQVVYSW